MPITFDCPCGKTLRVPDEHAGRRAKCPVCNAIVAIPGPEPVMEVVEEKPTTAKPGSKPTSVPGKRNTNDDAEEGGVYRISRD